MYVYTTGQSCKNAIRKSYVWYLLLVCVKTAINYPLHPPAFTFLITNGDKFWKMREKKRMATGLVDTRQQWHTYESWRSIGVTWLDSPSCKVHKYTEDGPSRSTGLMGLFRKNKVGSFHRLCMWLGSYYLTSYSKAERLFSIVNLIFCVGLIYKYYFWSVKCFS